MSHDRQNLVLFNMKTYWQEQTWEIILDHLYKYKTLVTGIRIPEQELLRTSKKTMCFRYHLKCLESESNIGGLVYGKSMRRLVLLTFLLNPFCDVMIWGKKHMKLVS